MRTLVVNAGSSSLKVRLLGDGDAVLASFDLDAVAGEFVRDDLDRELQQVGPFDAVGHRVVHGGPRFREPVIVTREVIDAIEDLTPLAPLHQPAAAAGMRLFAELHPDTPAVACFDTAFHATIPPSASTYALPEEWREKFGLRRYGFHGLSHAYASRRAGELLHRDISEQRIVTCHLGAGASLAAVRHGVCVDTTMGFTPMEGVVMATRSGSVDPGMLLWLQGAGGLSLAEVQNGVERAGGLMALAGTGDMRTILAATDDRSRLAVDVYVHRLRAAIAAMAAAMDGLDVLVFTGGIGENAAPIRSLAVAGLRFLGPSIEESANANVGADDADVTAVDAGAHVVVVHAREDIQIVRGVRAALGAA
ncbi:MAG: acetate kinase [Frankiaceae bacterium]|nr:acetate kinase [Frankiaceae bacterium]